MNGLAPSIGAGGIYVPPPRHNKGSVVMISGSCLCGEVQYTVEGKFDHFFLCHCRHCQKDTGSAHAANLFSHGGQLTWRQGEALVTSFTLEGSRHCKSFCSRCGSALPSLQLEGELLVVPAGSVDEPLQQRPNAHLFTRSRASWDADLEQLQAFETLPG